MRQAVDKPDPRLDTYIDSRDIEIERERERLPPLRRK